MDKSVFFDLKEACNFSTSFRSPSKLDKKFNMKIRKSDFELIDEIAKFEGVTRSAILNFLIHENLVHNLLEIPEPDTQLLIAHQADKREEVEFEYEQFSDTWTYIVIQEYMQVAMIQVYKNIRDFNEPSWDPNASLHLDPSYQNNKKDIDSNHSDSFKALVNVKGWGWKNV